MSQSPAIPLVRPSAITPDWLGAVLRKAGHDVRVAAFDAKRVGTGQVGESVRFTLAFAGDARGAPATVVGKFPSSDETSRAAGVLFGNYIREVNFYNQLAATALITTPRCLHAQVETATHEFVLIMEDLAPAKQGDQLRGVSVDQAALALSEAAKLHASHWGEDRFDAAAWMYNVSASPTLTPDDMMATLWAGFCQRYGTRVNAQVRLIGETITGAHDRIQRAYDGPKCLIHNDFRPDNMMFGTAEGGHPLVVVDWQTVGYGCCMADVSYFMGGALGLNDRRANEAALLRGYHGALIALGVRDYSFERLWRDYARYSFALFTMGFSAAMVVERTPRGDDMFFAMIETATAHIMDHKALDLL